MSRCSSPRMRSGHTICTTYLRKIHEKDRENRTGVPHRLLPCRRVAKQRTRADG
ncbi:hypothetical protein L208DRAFT_1389599, partial [Tricholoma matsutake]